MLWQHVYQNSEEAKEGGRREEGEGKGEKTIGWAYYLIERSIDRQIDRQKKQMDRYRQMDGQEDRQVDELLEKIYVYRQMDR